MESLSKRLQLALLLIALLGALSLTHSVLEVLALPHELVIHTAVLDELHAHKHSVEHGDSLQSAGHVKDVQSGTLTLTQGVWITGMEMLTENAPQFIVHHIHLADLTKKDPYCPTLPELLMDMGQDAAPIGHFPDGYGIYVPEGTKLFVNAALHNPEPPLGTGEEYENVSVGFKLFVDRLGTWKNLKPVTLHVMTLADADICNATTFTVPPHTTSFTKLPSPDSRTSGSVMRISKPGTIIALGAHIHAWEGGKKLDVYLNGNLVTTFYPKKFSDTPEVWRTDPYFEKIPVHPGDVLTISATYANPYDVPETGAMGMLAVFINYDQN